MNDKQYARGRRVSAVAAVVASAALLAACGSTGKSGRSSSPDPSIRDFAGTYKIMSIDEVTQGSGVSQQAFPEMVQGVQAGVDSLNRAGGIVGPKGEHYSVKLITCDTQGTPNGANNCAQKAISDGVVAIVGGEDMYNSYLTTLAAHDIPNIAPLAVSGVLSDANSYPIYGGGTIELVGSLAALASLHKNSVAVVASSASTSAISSIIAPVLGAIPQLKASTVGVGTTAVDMSPYVQAALRADGTAAFVGGSQLTAFIQAFQQQAGGKGKALISSNEILTPDVIDHLGKYAEGVYVASAFLPSSDTAVPEVAAFVEAMRSIGKSASLDEISEDGYSGVQLFAQAVKGMSLSSVTGKAIKAKLDGMTDVRLGLSAPFSFKTPFTGPPNPKLSRLFNPSIVYERVESGKLVVVNKGANPFVNAYTAAPFTVR